MTCCAFAQRLPPERLAALNDELRRPDHRSFRKLAAWLGADGMKSAIERHKHKCLGITTLRVPPVQDPPPAKAARVDPESVPPDRGTVLGHPGTVAPGPTKSRAPVSHKSATSLEERHAYIQTQLASGTWDSARDIDRCAEMWGLHPDSVRHTVRHVLAGRRVNRGDVEAREEESLAFYAWQVDDLRDSLNDCDRVDDRAKVHARLTEVRARMDSIAIPRGGAAGGSSAEEFTRAVGQYVEAVNATLEDVAGVGLDVADIPAEHIERVLRAARAKLDARLAALVEPALVNAANEAA